MWLYHDQEKLLSEPWFFGIYVHVTLCNINDDRNGKSSKMNMFCLKTIWIYKDKKKPEPVFSTGFLLMVAAMKKAQIHKSVN